MRHLLPLPLLAALVLAAAPAAGAAGVKEFAFEIAGGKLVGGRTTVRVVEGDRVRLRWRADEAGELHLHGYDLTVRVAPDKVVPMEFRAGIAGRFGIELHGNRSHHHKNLVYIEVHPQ